ncbi:MAG: PaaI family thioesterase [Pseudomonadota bacterium]|uniref:PaaI family thioesterase n=1 Tax=unclassified Phenylobacterium TaxID=2640670 RepID=UPI0006F7F331|nr:MULTISPECIES: PaaI family thioesterase [unclassified Phenylobacterium]KRB51050.1 thioesterase [Phenylobacterium sp. Root700]MBT9472765.1 PaaI family thioesterase [Phenylobacterium sp.]
MSEAAERLKIFLGRVPYVRFLGMRAELAGDEMTATLPFAPHLVGNTVMPALHGGALGAFMEMTALAQLSVTSPASRVHKTIDISIEYLRPGKAQFTYARADVRKVGRQFANVHVEAWQEARSKPVAFLRGHFLLREG